MASTSPTSKPFPLKKQPSLPPVISNATELVAQQKQVLERPPIAPPLVQSSAPKAEVSDPVAKIVAVEETVAESKALFRDPNIDGVLKVVEKMRGSLKNSDVLEEQARKRGELHTSTAGLEERIRYLINLLKQTNSYHEEMQAELQHMKEELCKEKGTVANLMQHISEMAEERRKEREAVAGQHAKLVTRIATLEARSPDISTVVVPKDVGATAQIAQKPTQILHEKELIPKAPEQKVVSAIAAPKIAAKTNEGPNQAKVGLPIDSSRRSTTQPAQAPSISATPAKPLKAIAANDGKDVPVARAGRADQLIRYADKFEEVVMFPLRTMSALPKSIEPASKMLKEKIRIFVRDYKQRADRNTVGDLHTAIRYIKHVHESQATLLDMEQSLRKLKTDKDLYLPSWGTKLSENYDIARAYAQRLDVELNKLPANDDMYDILRLHWSDEVARLRIMVEDTGSRWGFTVSVNDTLEQDDEW